VDKPTEPQETEAKSVFVKPELRVLDVKSTEGGASPDVAEALGALS
jgi:hypothetical protein